MPSDAQPTALSGRSHERDPLAALREALWGVQRQLAAAGGGPHHLTGMSWEAPEPGAVHPARRDVDLLYREAFGGFRPPLALLRGADEPMTVRAEARIVPPPAEPVYRGLTLAALAREYSPRGQVPDMAAVFARWTADGAAFRARHAALDLAYGPSAGETLDLYRPPGAVRPPVWAYLHGGFWQAVGKDQNAHFMAGLVDAGFAVANIDYGLAPQVPLGTIVAQLFRALRFLVDEADALGIDADRLYVAGHSAGAHLAAMAATDAGGPPLGGVLLLSGIFDVTPLALLPMGRLLGLDDAKTVGRLSPLLMRPLPNTKVRLAVGGLESDEFKRQSRALAERWNAPPPTIVDDANHFDLLDHLVRGDLLAAAVDIASDRHS